MKTLLLTLTVLLMATAALAQTRPPMTVQISEERDTSGYFTNWQELSVSWTETAVPAPPDPKAITTRAIQKWVVPDVDTGLYWRFQFVRNVPGEYAIRICFGTLPEPETIWSEVAVMYIQRPKGPTPG